MTRGVDTAELRRAIEATPFDVTFTAGDVVRKVSKKRGLLPPEPAELGPVGPVDVEAVRAELTAAADAIASRIVRELSPTMTPQNTCLDAPALDREIMREPRRLTQILSPDERREEGEVLAKNVAKRIAIEDIAKLIGRQTADVLKSLIAGCDASSSAINRGKRDSAVGVAHVLSVDAQTVQIVRLDTGEVIDSRQSSEKERQLSLLGDK